MNYFLYPVHHRDSVNRWRTTRIVCTPFESPKEAFEAEVNLGEAYVQIVYPVRRAFLRENNLAGTPLYRGDYPHLYFPFEGNRVDFSTFQHMPQHMEVNAMTLLDAPEEGDYPFRVFTCGGVKLWVNGEEALCFSPYTRNIPAETEAWLHLRKGRNEICVYADELAERDVFFYYELRYEGTVALEGALPMEEDAEEIREVEAFLKSCYFPRDSYTGGDLELHYDGSLLTGERALTIERQNAAFPLPDSVHKNGAAAPPVARPGENRLRLGAVEDFHAGIFSLEIGVQVGGAPIRRTLVVAIIPAAYGAVRPAATLEERKRQALELIANGTGEEIITRAMVICEREGALPEYAHAFVRSSLEMIHNMEDCADFYLVPMLWFISRYRSLIPEELHREIETEILRFRYWIDEPGNDVMWYFSENHAFLFHTAQYLAGSLYPDRTFSAGGKSGREQAALGRKRIEDWFALFFAYGYAEWNSATYIPIDLIGFFVLYEMAPDPELREMAKRALDFTFRIMVENSFGGVMSSTCGRAYEDTLKARQMVEPAFVQWVAYGKGHASFRGRSVSLFCISGYEPPAWDRKTGLQPGEWRTVELDQGIGKVKTYSMRTEDYFVSSVRRFRPFEHGHQQHVMDAVLGEANSSFYVNHPGERLFSGQNRPSYWAGNGTLPLVEQYRGLVGMIFRIDPRELVHFIHAYVPQYGYEEVDARENWLFLRAGRAYLGAWFSGGFSLTKRGANTGKELISRGLNHGVIVRCGNEAEFGGFAAFRESLCAAEVSYDGAERLFFRDPAHGPFAVGGGETLLDGKPYPKEDCPDFKVQAGLIKRL